MAFLPLWRVPTVVQTVVRFGARRSEPQSEGLRGRSPPASHERVLAMLVIVAVLFAMAAFAAAVAIALGWVVDSTQPGRYWYPAGPDPEPRRFN